MFELALRCAGPGLIEDLGRVAHICRRDFEERETFLFRAQMPSLEYLNLLIENALLLRANRTGRVYAGFEKLSRMEPVIDRYLRIADLSERVYIFGAPDWKPPRHPHLKLITLAEDAILARESFLITESSIFNAALVAVREDEAGEQTPEAGSFRVFKSSDPAIVKQLTEAAEGLIDNSLAA